MGLEAPPDIDQLLVGDVCRISVSRKIIIICQGLINKLIYKNLCCIEINFIFLCNKYSSHVRLLSPREQFVEK